MAARALARMLAGGGGKVQSAFLKWHHLSLMQ
eukprot:CAMPEP_0194739072 /NCGR_PEP_ID=MMETSP0296-20130528/87288_1 /TAXON_ID=39354 /ORGANISM="Heterosigma akashiwo, Strain CCMP2393" /LENGTH=31 /DNA_ID= /DNA_START= /DNA_END= /DNA_ORIENTATION=